jgi:GH15 family glucan-1,4-alpha-glucosidase
LPALPSIPARIEDYALLSDCRSAALVSRAGSIDWLCWPRFDSPACFAALLGAPENGHWQICPEQPPRSITRHYRDGSTIVETIFQTETGTVALIDFMPMESPSSAIVRIVEGRAGTVDLRLRLKLRFDYGSAIPWVNQLDEPGQPGIVAIAGPNLVVLRSDIPTYGIDLQTAAEFTLTAGQSLRFVLSYGPSHQPPPAALDAARALQRTEQIWRDWSGRCQSEGEHGAIVRRSLITLKALTYAQTGGIVAAPTTSLPEQIGGRRNWDYRYCWLRDSTATLRALMDAGYYDEAQAWGLWLHRSVAGSAAQLQIMYGIAGERHLDEWEVPWLPGYENAAPVRIGNQAARQLQLDVFGEIMSSMRQARLGGLVLPPAAWAMQTNLLERLLEIWREPDEGMWEVRGARRQFTFSKIMAWSAFNCAIKDAEQYNLEAPLETWRAARDEIRALVLQNGFSPGRNSFTQSLGSDRLDASLLLIPMLGFLPPDDPKVTGTVEAIESHLMQNGLVLRYEPDPSLDGQQGREGAFLACSFWLVAALSLQHRAEEAGALFAHLLTLANDVGLFAEEYDTTSHRQVGNFPQAFSHLALVMAVRYLNTLAPVIVGSK